MGYIKSNDGGGRLFDPWILLPVLALLGLGLVMVASASMVISDHYFHNPFHFVLRHLIYLVLALVVMWVLTRVKSAWWQRNTLLFLLVAVFLLLIVLIPGIGRSVNGSRRWLGLPFFTFQVSEFAKWATILFMAGFISRHGEALKNQMVVVARPLGLLAIMGFLLLLEPDFGTVVVLMATSLMMLFLARAPVRPFLMILGVVLLGMLCLIWLSPYRLERLMIFAHPWSKQFGSGYQLTQSLIAFGRGGVTGVGLGNSMQKLFYLPEAHTDFLYAVLGEELGLLGAILTLLLYACLVWRLLWCGRQLSGSGQVFAGFFCYGVGCWFALQAAINTGVTLGVLPTKGLTLPFISYGGTSLVISCAAIGVVLRLLAENRQIINGRSVSWGKNQPAC